MKANTAKSTLEQLIVKYQPLYDHVRSVRLGAEQHRGHGFEDHDFLVAQNCLLIAPSKKVGELAWVAALLHSFDRSFGKRAGTMVNLSLAQIDRELSATETTLIKDAVDNHDGMNDPDDSEVLITLRDADRLANIGPTWIIRMGQHWCNIPAMELKYLFAKNPASTYKKPCSCLDELRFVLEEWPDEALCPGFGMRLPKAKKLSKKYFELFRRFVELTQMQYVAAGLAEARPLV